MIGAGYVGLVTGACFAEMGNRVVCIDSDGTKIAALKDGHVPFFEPGLDELVHGNVDAGRLSFHTSIADGIRGAAFIFIAVGTPLGADGQVDLRNLKAATLEISASIDSNSIVVNKSTVPVETSDTVAAMLNERKPDSLQVGFASNPEFLREGSAIEDFMHPDRIVIGASNAKQAAAVASLYASLNTRIIFTDVRTAEMIKYSANAFLATKISFINEIAHICERIGVDVTDVAQGIGSDRRIGSQSLDAGLGFGGSCLPKDVLALARVGEANRVQPLLLRSVLSVNHAQIRRVVDRLDESLGYLNTRSVAVLGLSFKPNTDDVRESPAIALIRTLVTKCAQVRVHDPKSIPKARLELGDGVVYSSTPYEAAEQVDAVIVATDWSEYKHIDLALLVSRMRGNLLIDARNIFDPVAAREAGLLYSGLGRQSLAG